MDKSIAELLKLFLEKHFIPTIISVVVAIVVLVITPLDSWVIIKIGKVLYLVLSFGITILIIELLLFSFNRIRIVNNNHRKKLRKQEERKREKEQEVKELWEFIDGLSPKDRQYIDGFLETNNEPIESWGQSYLAYDSLLSNREWVITTEISKYYDFSANEEITDETVIKENKLVPFSFDLYKLKQDKFDLLKYSIEKYGRISNF